MIVKVCVHSKGNRETPVSRESGCFDASGRPILFGHGILFKNRLTDFSVFTGFAEPIPDGRKGFSVMHENVRFVWECAGEICRDCLAVEE